MNMRSKYVIVFIYLLATDMYMCSARKDEDEWTPWDIVKYGGLAVVGGVGAVVAAPVVLASAGFTGAGIAAGSLAAVTQAGIGNVIGGSTFAALQSAGVAGLGGTVSAGLATAGAAVGAVVAKVTDKRKSDDDN